jgi:hypothetical protein
MGGHLPGIVIVASERGPDAYLRARQSVSTVGAEASKPATLRRAPARPEGMPGSMVGSWHSSSRPRPRDVAVATGAKSTGAVRRDGRRRR